MENFNNGTFMEAMEKTLEARENVATTENGAIGYRSTGRSLVDLNFSVPQLRKLSPVMIIDRWEKVYDEYAELAMRWLFFLRDVKLGLGERRTFRIILHWMAEKHPQVIRKLIGTVSVNDGIEVIPFYGRWDDLLTLLDTPMKKRVLKVVKDQLESDIQKMNNGECITLLAKWLPSLTATSSQTRKLARKIAKEIGMRETDYRKKLSALRKYMNVTERMMTDQEWDEIDYSSVPSRANLLYSNAFLKHDYDRRQEFLDQAITGNVKMNSGTVYPYEIVHKSINSDRGSDEAKSMEAMWKNLPNTISDPNARIIVVADGSGSMEDVAAGSTATAWSVAHSLAIYFAERMTGEFANKYITFSRKPELVNLPAELALHEKLEIAKCYYRAENTNIEAVFDLILETAKANHMDQSQMPTSILLISDMEFDSSVESDDRSFVDRSLFDIINIRYADAGYKLPRIVFWNVNSRSGAIPMTENQLGCVLISGFSTNLASMVMSGETDPYKCLVNTLMDSRYDPIAKMLGYDE